MILNTLLKTISLSIGHCPLSLVFVRPRHVARLTTSYWLVFPFPQNQDLVISRNVLCSSKHLNGDKEKGSKDA